MLLLFLSEIKKKVFSAFPVKGRRQKTFLSGFGGETPYSGNRSAGLIGIDGPAVDLAGRGFFLKPRLGPDPFFVDIVLKSGQRSIW